jgi:hypothetical protein
MACRSSLEKDTNALRAITKSRPIRVLEAVLYSTVNKARSPQAAKYVRKGPGMAERRKEHMRYVT